MSRYFSVGDRVLFLGQLSILTLSGSVTRDGGGAIRNILVYRNFETFPAAATWSNSSGIWSVTVNGNKNDKYTVICRGVEGENSQIFSNVVVT